MAIFVPKTPQNNSASNLRPDGSVVQQHGNVLRDEEADLNKDKQADRAMSRAAVVYLTNAAGLVLTVSNDTNGEDVNMPGGGVEQGEEPEDAAKRELWEETGITATELVQVHTAKRNGKFVTYFKAMSWTGKPRSSKEGEVGWSSPEEVKQSRYGRFFQDMLDAIE